MNDNARKWVEVLRSGEYQQTQGVLRKWDGFCCLGVACDLYAQENPQLGAWDEDRFTFLNRVSTLPGQVRDWLGLSSIIGKHSSGCLADDNDEGKTFSEIADIIEDEPDGLFAEAE